MAHKRGVNDPQRSERITEAAIEVITEHGVHATTHRLIAARAEVPLGSLTYYFEGLSDILEQAFTRLSVRMAAHYQGLLAAATSEAEACEAVTELICGDSYAATDEVRALFEMYSYGNYNPRVRELCLDWVLQSRRHLREHFSEPAARALDALVEGWPMHQAWEGERMDREVVLATVRAIVERFPRG